ncbi:TDP-4-oxo-6-deoxy-D-glucose transaminase [Candidatus Desulfarcum epimagneticum]|uniref:TDP-4-oxo-6-deoxy-D-glucose transaminase n=1 Tax=uncultured Desulfobacteraceae bacterium TaxID=218296 RepID=A0A484HHG8_9BACT|nr:TDP-4-oxo-6-deoxy-D-glucose transaminase [uncultured Desulfobacteraceae bacterium]
MREKKIPFNKPFVVGRELYYIAKAVMEKRRLSGDGFFTRQCHSWLEKTLQCPKAFITHSCTAALEMAAILCGIEPGDEIIMPSYTFVSTANAFVLRGGVPVFVDIRSDTLNMDETKIEEAVTDKTKAIVVVHYAGFACEMDSIMSIAKKHNLFVIEDAAHALLSTYENNFLGTIGDLGTLSFHETKNIISGEGGALLINNKKFIERSEIIWEKGTNRKKFFRGEVDQYTWVDIGSSYLPGEITAAFLYAQLENAEKIIAKRCELFNLYHQLLNPLEDRNFIRVAKRDPQSLKNNGHIFYIIAKNAQERTRLIKRLRENNITAVFHYVPLHLSPAGKKYGRSVGDLPNTIELSERVLRLPLFYEMEDSQVYEVVSAIKNFYSKRDMSIKMNTQLKKQSKIIPGGRPLEMAKMDIRKTGEKQ